jgi:hypothetical protein
MIKVPSCSLFPRGDRGKFNLQEIAAEGIDDRRRLRVQGGETDRALALDWPDMKDQIRTFSTKS